MNPKKSILSYLVWLVFAVICCLQLATSVVTGGLARYIHSTEWMMLAICIFFVLIVLIFGLVRFLSDRLYGRIREPEKIMRILAVVFPVLVLISVAARLTIQIMNQTPLVLSDDSFYREAYVAAGGQTPEFMTHGASWLYVCLLHLVFRIFGNTLFAGIVLQMVLFIFCLLLLYFSCKSLCGVIPAAVSMAAFGLMPVSMSYVFALTPELFYLTLYLLGLFFVSAVAGSLHKEKNAPPMRYGQVFFLGLYIGFLIYLDIFGISMLFFLAGMYYMGEDRAERRRILFENLFAWFGVVCGLCLILFALYFACGINPSEYASVFYEMYFEEIGLQYWRIKPDTTVIGSVLIMSLAFYIIPSYIMQKRNRCSQFILSLFLASVLPVLSIAYMNYQMLVTMLWCVLGGLGVYGMFCMQEMDEEEEAEENADWQMSEYEKRRRRRGSSTITLIRPNEEDKNAYKEVKSPEEQVAEISINGENVIAFDIQGDSHIADRVAEVSSFLPENSLVLDTEEEAETEKSAEIKAEESAKPEEPVLMEEAAEKPAEEAKEPAEEKVKEPTGEKAEEPAEKKPEKPVEVRPAEVKKPAPGEPLHNPLPIPKKHIKKEFNFKYEIPEEKMKFDREIPADDDFDH